MRILVVVFTVLYGSGSAMERSAIYMKKSQIADQTASGSGYAYQINSGGPSHYTTFNTNSNGHLNNFGYPPVTVGRYTTQELPVASLPIINYFQGENKEFEPVANLPINSYGLPANVAAYSLPILRKNLDLPYGHAIGGPASIAGGGEELDVSSKYAKGGGESYGQAEGSSKGEQADSGYKNQHGYAKGEQGKHDKEQHKSYYNKEGGKKAGHHDSGKHYAANEASAKGQQGANFKQSSGHRKGSKTTGYHNVYHKDEYKKDHSFYDESDKSGHFNKYGDYDGHHASEKGAYEKGGQHGSGYHGNTYGAKGYSDKGRFLDNASGFNAAKGQDSYFKDNSDYAKKAGSEHEESNGYSGKEISDEFH